MARFHNALTHKVLCKILSRAAQGNRYEGIQGCGESAISGGEEEEPGRK